MKKEDCFYLGKIIKPFGYKGEVVLFLDVDDMQTYKDLPYVYIEINKRLIKYDIDSFRFHGNKVVVTFQDVRADEVSTLIGKEMYLPLEFLPKLEGNQFYFHEVIDFEVIDKEKGNIGTIAEIIDNTTQPIMSIDFNGKEILMPLIDEILDKVDRENRKMYIHAPEGLIDIYLT